MKKLFIIAISLCLLVLPSCLKADIKVDNLEEALKSEGIEPLFEEYKENDKQAIIYFFREKGEEKSVSFLNYLNSIYSEYGKYFKLRSYDISEDNQDNQDNLKLFANVVDHLSDNVHGAPFIVIGDVRFVTYGDDVSESGNIIKAINMAYESEEKTDTVQEVLKRYYRNYDLMIAVIIALVILFIALMIYASRKEKSDTH